MEVTLTVAQGQARVRRICLRSAETIVGRQKGCDLRIPSAEVSRRHCLLSYADGQLTVEDLDSSNGTFVNQVRVKGRAPVHAGDRLRIGPVIFIVDYPMTSKSGPHPAPAAGSAAEKAAPRPGRPADKARDDLPIPLADEPPAPPKKRSPVPPSPPATDVIPFQDQSDSGEAAPIELDDTEPLRLPEGENFRDFLSRMDE